MIEFRGTYHPTAKADAIVVLVQYDGVILHVWHLSEPFHRLIYSDEFTVSKPNFTQNPHTIKLPNGGRIKTDDGKAFERLSRTQKKSGARDIYALTQNRVLALIGSMSLAIGLWWLAINGHFF